MRFSKRLAPALLALALTACASVTTPDLSGMSFSEDPLVGKFVWHDLITEDIEAAGEFYSELFGWQLEPAESPGIGRYLVARIGDVYVAGLVSAEPRADGALVTRWLPYVSVEDVDASAAATAEAGGLVLVPPMDVDLGRVAAISDPEGAILGLSRSSIGDPDEQTTAGAVGKVVWNELLAIDPANAGTFYEEVFGYSTDTIERRGGTYTMLAINGHNRAGILDNPSSEEDALWLTYFGVDDPATAARRAEELGGEILLAPSDDLRDGTIAVITDPGGAILVLRKWPL